MIVLPESLAHGENTATLRYCLAHEWSHIFRHDVSQWWADQCLQPLVWFQPLYWFLAREMRICQDQLADCFAAQTTSDPLSYADLLLHFAQQRGFPRAAAALTMIQGHSKLSRRVRLLLDDDLGTATLCRRRLVAALSIALALFALLSSTIDFRRASAQSFPKTTENSLILAQNNSTDSSPTVGLSQFARSTTQAARYSAKPGFDIDGDSLPAGVVARLGTKYFRPGQESTDRDMGRLVFLPDSKTLVQVTGVGSLQFWDSTTGRLQKQTSVSDQNVYAAASTPDGHWIVVGSFRKDEMRHDFVNSFQLIDTQAKQDPLKWEVVDDPFEKLAISPDGRTVAWGRNKISLFDVASQTELPGREIEGQMGGLCFSPDGKTLAIGGPGKVLLWNWAGKEEPRSVIVPGHPRFAPHTVDTVAFSPDSKFVAAGTDDTLNRIVLADAETGKHVRVLTMSAPEDWRFTSLAFSPDGKQVATNAGAGAAIWDVASGRIVRQLQQPSGGVSKLVYSHDGRRLAGINFYAGAICVWDLQTGEQYGADRPGHFESPNTLRFFNHDQHLASAGDDGTIRIWNLADSRQLRAMRHELVPNGPTGWIRAMDVSPDGNDVASSSLDNTVRLWETATGREIYRLPGHGRMGGTRAIHFSPDNKQFVAWGDDMRMVRWDVATGKALEESAPGAGGGLHSSAADNPFEGPGAGPRIDNAWFSTDLQTLLLVGNGPQTTVRRFAVESGKEMPQINRPSTFSTRAALLPDNLHLLIAGWNRTRVINLPGGIEKPLPPTTYPVEVFNLPDERIIANREFVGHGADKIAYSRDGRLAAIAVVGEPPKIDLCTLPDLADAGQIELPSRAGAVEFSASGKLLAASVADGTILVWDLQHIQGVSKP